MATRGKHGEVHSKCRFKSWAECDDAYAEWQAMQQVLLAYRLLMAQTKLAQTKWWDRGDKTQFRQLMKYIAGEQQDIYNGDGLPAQDAWTKRLKAAINRVVAADLPRYNLYEVPTSGTTT